MDIKNLTIKLIKPTDDQIIIKYFDLFKLLFPSEPEWDLNNIKSWIDNNSQNMYLYGIFSNEDLIGYRHVWFKKSSKICYVPYAGIYPNYQKKGIYPQLCKLTEEALIKEGFKLIINEVDNPEMIIDLPERHIAQKRIKMFVEKLDYHFVKNTNSITYERNSPYFESEESMQKSVFKYLLGFKILTPQNIITLINNTISKEDYEFLFWQIREIEFSENGEATHSEMLKFKPISNFINNLNNCDQNYFELISNNVD